MYGCISVCFNINSLAIIVIYITPFIRTFAGWINFFATTVYTRHEY